METLELKLSRRYLGKSYTIGVFFIDGLYVCEIIEDVVRDLNKDGDLLDDGETKIPKETAIPYGRYRVYLSMSPKFKRVLPILEGVKHFTGIRIHKGEDEKSTWGCLIPGLNKIRGKVIDSEKYEMLIIERILKAEQQGKEIWITIN